MKMTVIIYSNDPETVWNAFRFANTSLVYDNQVKIFLLGRGVEAMMLSTLKYDILEQAELFRSHGGIVVGDQDVFANVVGGVRVLETAADLAILAATVSSLRNRPLGKDLVAFGEVGLAGEVRPVQRGQERIREAAKLGFKRALVPAANMPKKGDAGIELLPVRRLTEALEILG